MQSAEFAAELRQYLSGSLPEYMVPPYYVQLDRFPLTPAGKIDRNSLPDPKIETLREYSAPRDEIEESLARIWSWVLEVDKNNIGIDADFFELGGHSLNAMQLIAKINKELNVEFSLAELFKRSSIRKLSGYIKSLTTSKYSTINPVPKKEYYPLSSAQKRVYIARQFDLAGTNYNVPNVVFLSGQSTKKKLNEIIRQIISRHEILRTSFKMIDGEPVQIIHETVDFSICYLGKVSKRGSDFRISGQLEDTISGFSRPFDLTQAPLLRVGYVEVAHDKPVLLFDLHHIVTDGISQDILSREFIALSAGGELTPLRLHYKDFVEWQISAKQKESIKHQQAYWIEVLCGELPVLELPTDYPRPSVQSYDGAAVSFVLDSRVTKKIKELLKYPGITLYMVILALYTILLHKLSGQEDIIVGTPVSVRPHADLEKVIGFFINTLAIRSRPCGEKTFSRFLEEVKQCAVRAFENQGCQLEDLVEQLVIKRDTSRSPIFDVMFNMLNQVKFSGDIPGFDESEGYRHRKHPTKSDLILTAMDYGDRIFLDFEYCTRLFKPTTIERFIDYFNLIALSVLNSPNSKLSDVDIITEKQKREIYHITPAAGANVPASYHQERLWFIDQFESGYLYKSAPIYHNIPVILEISGNINCRLLERSIRDVINRHKALRTRIFTIENKPVQIINKEVNFNLSVINRVADNNIRVKTGDSIISFAIKEAAKAFLIDKELLIRGALICVEKQKNILLLTLHHIIADRYSIDILVKEILLHYKAYMEKQVPDLPRVTIQYPDFSQWQRNMPVKLEEYSLGYWKNKLKGKLQALEIRTDRPRSLVHTYHSALRKFKIPEGLIKKIALFGKERGMGNEIIFLGAFKALLSRYSGLNEIVVGTSVSNRIQPGAAGLIGPAANLLVLRSFIPDLLDFLSFLSALKETVDEAIKYQSMPFDILVLKLNPDIDMSRTALFDVLFIYEELPIFIPELEGLKINMIETNLGWGKYDLNLLIRKEAGYLYGNLVYNSDYYNDSTISRFIGHYIELLNNVIEAPYREISEFSLLSAAEMEDFLCALNEEKVAYPGNKCIHEMFSEQVFKTHGNTAVAIKDKNLTYGELDKRAGWLAGKLLRSGVRPGVIVAIMAERSIEMIIGILAILKSNGAYLPIDPEYPETRKQYMLKDSAVDILLLEQLTGEGSGRRDMDPGDWQGETIFLEDTNIENEVFAVRENRSINVNSSGSPAYIIYTSGTTGNPKGTIIDHHNVVQLMFNDKFPFEFDCSDVWTLFHSFCFDFSVWEMYGALLYGGKLIIVARTETRDTEKYLKILKSEKVTILNQTPKAFYNLLNYELTNTGKELLLRYVIFGGESLNPLKLKKWKMKYPDTRLINMFGITETTVHVTYKEITGADIEKGMNTIGKSLPTMSTYIMDRNCNPLPTGVPGELYVGGEGVCRGYLGQVELTSDRFIDNPYKEGEVVYRSGDLARFLENGELEYLGRIDEQVQVRGFRIELREIEGRLIRHPSVNEAVVLAKEDEEGDIYLCAYIIAEENLTTRELREYLINNIPGYMIPNHFVLMDRFPMTPNGKIDKKAFPKPNFSVRETFSTPRNTIERKLIKIWSEVLGIDENVIDIDSNFFDLGGHSLKATILTANIHKELSVKVLLQDIFRLPSIRELARSIGGEVEAKYAAIDPLEEKEYYRISPSQKRLYILQRFDVGSCAYNISYSVFLEGIVEKEKVENTIRKLIFRHDSLRTCFIMVKGEPVQKVNREVEFLLDYSEIEEGKEGEIIDDFFKPFDLSEAPLLKAALIKIDTQKHILILDMHHIISDGTSNQLIVNELAMLYRGTDLPLARVRYKDYTGWQNNDKQQKELNKQEKYWLKVFEGAIPVLSLPTDNNRPMMQSFMGDRIYFEIDMVEKKALRQILRDEEATLFMLLLSMFSVFLSKLSGQEDIIVGTPTACRRHADLENIIGMFVNTLALRNYPLGRKTFREFLREVKDSALQAFENQEYQFEDLIEKVSVSRDTSRNPLFDVMFVLQNMEEYSDISEEKRVNGFTIRSYETENKTSKFDLTLACIEGHEKLFFILEYCTKLFKKETIKKFIRYFMQVADAVITNPDQTLSLINILSTEEMDRLLYEFNDTAIDFPGHKTMTEFFVEQAEKVPGRAAVFCGDSRLTYGELNRRAALLGDILVSKGVTTDVIVGLMVERSLEMIIGIYAILKAGGAYCPIEPGFPRERIDFMIKDSNAGLLLTQERFRGCATEICERIVIETAVRGSSGTTHTAEKGLPGDAVYLIYTSGSTGRPKGVIIRHKSLVNRINWMQQKYPIDKTDTILQKTPFTFDVSVWEIFWWSFVGAKVCMLNPNGEKYPDQITNAIGKHNITLIHFVPSMLNVFLDFIKLTKKIQNISNLKQVIASGEALTSLQVRSFNDLLYNYNATSLANLYGPTEAAIDVSYFDCPAGEDISKIPIGKPIYNTAFCIVDKDFRLLPIGTPGELCVSGEGLSRGYLNRPELTAEKFIRNPFSHSMLYRTGDLARWLPDGNIEFLGRLDNQVKIRGNRIELGEIEKQLLEHEKIKDTVVVVGTGTEQEDKYLCAYIVSDSKLLALDIREYLSGTLPVYMVPSYFVFIDRVPLSANGKVDYRALPVPEIKREEEYIAPRSKTEKVLIETWSKTLGIKEEKISINDNFFDIGGNSLSIIRMNSEINRVFKKEIPVAVIYNLPTIRSLTNYINKVDSEFQVPDDILEHSIDVMDETLSIINDIR